MFSLITSVSRARHRTTKQRHTSAPTQSMRILLAVALLVLALPALAIQPVQPHQHGTSHLTHPVVAPQLHVRPALGSNMSLAEAATAHAAVNSFASSADGTWDIRWDQRSNRPNLIQGSGIALIPGTGNDLSRSDIGLTAGQAVSMDTVANALQGFIARHHELLGTDEIDFRLDRDASSVNGKRTHRNVRFAQYYKGVPVDGAYLFFRISHGNIVQFGTHRVAPVAISVKPAMDRAHAFAEAFNQMPFTNDARIARVFETGELLIMPTRSQAQPRGTRYTGTIGDGYSHMLVWRFVYQLENDANTYEVIFNARSNELLEVRSLTDYAQATITGGVYPDGTSAEVVMPFPFVTVENNGTKTTDLNGHYDYSGGTASTTLGGKYFQINDNCGSVAASNNTDGNIELGSSGGTDCTTPGYGGAGNTHAARTGFYHLTMINRIAKTYLPNEGWLDSTVGVNVNINDQCNAYWDGFSLNFFKSGGGCANTGEIPGVFLHEWGHGIDSNHGGSADNGSGEAVGDTFAMIYMQQGCIGDGFRLGQTGECTGVRWPKAFSVHGQASGYPIAKPTTVEQFSPSECPYFTPTGFPYQGVMGYEGHRESLIISSANWDLIQNLITEYGPEQGWSEMNAMWYGSLAATQEAYQIVSGGRCNPQAEINGCAASNWYTAMLAADDDDGNLSNGTPNACRIWDAYDAHGMACGVRPACTAGSQPDFTIRAPTMTQTICVPDQAVYTIDIDARQGFANPVTLAASNLPTGVTSSFSVNPVLPGNSSQLILDSAGSTAAGNYSITVSGTAQDSPGHSVMVSLVVNDGPPDDVVLQGPTDGALDVPTNPVLTWLPLTQASSYKVELATDAAFSNIIVSQSGLESTSYQVSGLELNTTYYWRVTAMNSCGIGQPSAAFNFTTALPESYRILANVSGLQGDGVTVQLNDNPPITRSASGAFVFPSGILQGTVYEIAVTDQPSNPKQTCSVVNGIGTMPGHNVSNVRIECGEYVPGYTVGGSVSGLTGTGLVLELNGLHELAVSAGSFVFDHEVPDGDTYNVTVATQPASPLQYCSVAMGTGTIHGEDVTNVAVTCSDDRIFADGFEL